MKDHHTANPERDNFYHAVAEILSRGHTLIGEEIRELGECYGYSESSTGLLMDGYYAREALAIDGITLAVKRYKQRRISTDANARVIEHDFKLSKHLINEAIASSQNKRLSLISKSTS